MNKRQRKKYRKKKHLGEYQEFGFLLKLRFDSNHTVEEVDELSWRFITDFVEPRKLSAGGGGLYDYQLFVMRRKGSCTEADRAAALEWTARVYDLDRVFCSVGALVDAWHGPFEN